ncbi:MAG TPA: nucleoside monophosphate kinase [Patescibacteria group bacterium]|nr:nucleoside monophosphate kinase [Patescibacteria group bacterium]
MDISTVKAWLGTGSINIFGMPFSGKDTQARALAENLGAAVIAGGDILRSHPDQETIKKLMLTGELFPTDYYLDIITPFLSQPKLAQRPLVLSSVGRWHGEEETIMKAANQSGHSLKAVISLELDEDEIWRRFETSGKQKDRGFRYDDAGQILRTRLNEFQSKTHPVIDFYRNNGLLLDIDALGTPEEVTNRILDRLEKFSHA